MGVRVREKMFVLKEGRKKWVGELTDPKNLHGVERVLEAEKGAE